jgi:hypothetical protein
MRGTYGCDADFIQRSDSFIAVDQMAGTHMLKLERVQYRCLKIALGLMQSTHVQTLEVIGGVPQLRMRFSILNRLGLFYCWAPTLTGTGSPFKVEYSEDS